MDSVNLSKFRLAATLITIPGVKTIALESNTAHDGEDGVVPKKRKCNLVQSQHTWLLVSLAKRTQARHSPLWASVFPSVK